MIPPITDRRLLDAVQRVVLEPADFGAAWPSGLWTTAEVLAYLSQRQDRFLKETLAVCAHLQTALLVPGDGTADIPAPWLATLSVMWDSGTAGRPLLPLTRREADLLQPDWQQTPGSPLGYIPEEYATRQVTLVPAPDLPGFLHVFAAVVGQTFTGLDTGVAITVPDECAPYLGYGVLADMFGKQGRGYDEGRRAYCEARWDEGVALTQALLKAVVIS